jgi:ferredoxin
VALLATNEEAPQYLEALREQMAVAQAILHGLGYEGSHFSLLQGRDAADLEQELKLLARRGGAVPRVRARYAVSGEKRTTLDLALDHLLEHAARKPEEIALPAGALFGTVHVDKDKCTLCMSCVGACPASALQDNQAAPQLRFVEKNCVQCGLCASTCPEDAIRLEPRLLLANGGKARAEARVLHETEPFCCIRCGKPFGTLKGIENMLGKLAGHPMFQGAGLDRLKMCGDCRVIDIYSSTDEQRIQDV